MFKISKLKNFKEKDIVSIFKSVGWTSGSLRDTPRLMQALLSSETVYSAYDGERMVGMLSVISDGYNAYITYLVVMQEYHNKGCGTQLMKEFIKDYKGYRKQVMTEKAEMFYRKFGFGKGMKNFAGLMECDL